MDLRVLNTKIVGFSVLQWEPTIALIKAMLDELLNKANFYMNFK